MITKTKDKGQILFCLTDDKLLVANTGKPFSEAGMIAICNAHLSPKKGAEDDLSHEPFESEEVARSTLKSMCEDVLSAYKIHTPRIKEDTNSEQTLKREYAGRVLLELIQNAHDANSDNSIEIGEKGIGFKGVLNISQENIRIYSGHLHFVFDKQKAIEMLEKYELSTEYVPTMRLPTWKDKSQEDKDVQKIIDEYDTVIVLPFEKPLSEIQDDFNNFAKDENILLFLPALHQIKWQVKCHDVSYSHHWEKKVTSNKKFDIVTISHQFDDEENEYQYQLWKNEQAKLAIKLDENGRPQPLREYPNLYTYFKTKVPSPLPLLIHGNFPLQLSRNNIENNSKDNQNQYRNAIGDINALLERFLSHKQCAEILDFLDKNSQKNSASDEIWQNIREKAKYFTPTDTNGFTLFQLRTSSHNIETWEAFKQWLTDFRPNGLRDLPLLPLGTEKGRRTILENLFDESSKLTDDDLTTLPFFKTEGEKELKSSSEADIFLMPQSISQTDKEGLPIPILFLPNDASKAIEENSKLKEFLIDSIGIKTFNLASIVKTIIARLKVDSKIADKRPRALLNFLYDSYRHKDDPSNTDASELSKNIKVKTKNNGWQIANKTYAGEEWSNEGIETILSGKYFLEMPPKTQSEKDKEQWQRFYKWLGIAWQPKIIKFKEQEPNLPQWREYTNNISSYFFPRNYTSFPKWTNYKLEDTEILQKCSTFNYFAKNWRNSELEKTKYKEGEVKYFYRSDKSNPYTSYYRWCLANIAWVPTINNEQLHKPSEVFYGEVAEKLNNWVYKLPKNYHDKHQFLDAIGVRSDWSKLKPTDWQKWLQKAENLDASNNENNQNNIHNLLRLLLQKANEVIIKDEIGLWAINRKKDNTKNWQLFDSDDKDKIYYLDRPDLDKVYLENLWVFPVMLDNLQDKAEEHLNIQPLSKHLTGEVQSPKLDEEATNIIKDFLAERWIAIYAMLEIQYDVNMMKNIPQTAEKLWDTLDINIIQTLNIAFTLAGTKQGEQELSFYYQTTDDNQPDKLWLKKSPPKSYDNISEEGITEKSGGWDLAEALCYCFNLHDSEKSSIKDILCASKKEDLPELLLRYKITQATIDEIKQNLSPKEEIQLTDDTGEERNKDSIAIPQVNDNKSANEIQRPSEPPSQRASSHLPHQTISHNSQRNSHASQNNTHNRIKDINPAPNQIIENSQSKSLLENNTQSSSQNNSVSKRTDDYTQDKRNESIFHAKLVKEISDTPALIAPKAKLYQSEKAIESPVITDIPDILLGDDDKIYIVEVKVYQTNNLNQDNNELRRGIFQCLRYRLAYQKLSEYGGKSLAMPRCEELFKDDGTTKDIISVLAYNADFPEHILEVAEAENICCKVIK